MDVCTNCCMPLLSAKRPQGVLKVKVTVLQNDVTWDGPFCFLFLSSSFIKWEYNFYPPSYSKIMYRGAEGGNWEFWGWLATSLALGSVRDPVLREADRK